MYIIDNRRKKLGLSVHSYSNLFVTLCQDYSLLIYEVQKLLI